MKGIVKYNKKFYKKTRRHDVKEGDIVLVNCKRDSSNFQYNGIYPVNKWKEIHVKREGEPTLCLKLGYNISILNYVILEEIERKKSLPKLVDDECDYML